MSPGSMIVLDASALLESLTEGRDDVLFRRLATNNAVAPEIIDLEVLHVLRRQARHSPNARNAIDHDVAKLPDAPITRVPHRALLKRVWEPRHSITPYDASYVALAEELGVPLVTCDAKLPGAHGHQAKIELYSSN